MIWLMIPSCLYTKFCFFFFIFFFWLSFSFTRECDAVFIESYAVSVHIPDECHILPFKLVFFFLVIHWMFFINMIFILPVQIGRLLFPSIRWKTSSDRNVFYRPSRLSSTFLHTFNSFHQHFFFIFEIQWNFHCCS